MKPSDLTTPPAPLTPPDCNLQDFAFMPLDVARLRDSDMAAYESPEACWAAVLLWSVAWHQVPAASLPDDDRFLAKAAGYGRVVKEWMNVREGALHGWVKCADGRLYHPVVAEKANESWHKKLHHAWKKECDRIRKANKQREADGKPPLPFPPEPTLAAQQIPAERVGNPAESDDYSGGNDDGEQGVDETPPPADTSGQRSAEQHVDDESCGSPGKVVANDIPAESDGFPAESNFTSDGKPNGGNGNPLENALKGQGEGQGQGEYKNLPPGHRASAQPELSAEPINSTPVGLISKAMRDVGIMAQPADPRLIALADQGVSVDTIRAACDDAKRAKPNERIAPAYVFAILERWAREAADLNAAGATQPRASPRQAANANMQRLNDRINGTARHEPDDRIIDLNERPA